VLVCRCYIIKKLRGTSPREPSRARCVRWCIWAWQGRRAPPLGINYLVGTPRAQAHPGYYCLIDGQTNGSRPPSNNVVIKLSADKSARDRSCGPVATGWGPLLVGCRTSFSLRPPTSLSLSLFPSLLVTGIKAMSRLHGRPAILYALTSAHVVVSGRALGLDHADVTRCTSQWNQLC